MKTTKLYVIDSYKGYMYWFLEQLNKSYLTKNPKYKQIRSIFRVHISANIGLQILCTN